MSIGLCIIKYLLDQVTIRLISQLINMAFQEFSKNYLNCFNVALILTSFVPLFVLPAIFLLNLNKALLLLLAEKSAIAPLSKSKNDSSL